MSVLICQGMPYLSNWGNLQYLEHDSGHVLQNNTITSLHYTVLSVSAAFADLG